MACSREGRSRATRTSDSTRSARCIATHDSNSVHRSDARDNVAGAQKDALCVRTCCSMSSHMRDVASLKNTRSTDSSLFHESRSLPFLLGPPAISLAARAPTLRRVACWTCAWLAPATANEDANETFHFTFAIAASADAAVRAAMTPRLRGDNGSDMQHHPVRDSCTRGRRAPARGRFSRPYCVRCANNGAQHQSWRQSVTRFGLRPLVARVLTAGASRP
jgi:hypothetical protein